MHYLTATPRGRVQSSGLGQPSWAWLDTDQPTSLPIYLILSRWMVLEMVVGSWTLEKPTTFTPIQVYSNLSLIIIMLDLFMLVTILQYLLWHRDIPFFVFHISIAPFIYKTSSSHLILSKNSYIFANLTLTTIFLLILILMVSPFLIILLAILSFFYDSKGPLYRVTSSTSHLFISNSLSIWH